MDPVTPLYNILFWPALAVYLLLNMMKLVVASQKYISRFLRIYGCHEELSFNWRYFCGVHKLMVCYCQRSEGKRCKTTSKMTELPGVQACCSPSAATAANWIFHAVVTVLPKHSLCRVDSTSRYHHITCETFQALLPCSNFSPKCETIWNGEPGFEASCEYTNIKFPSLVMEGNFMSFKDPT